MRLLPHGSGSDDERLSEEDLAEMRRWSPPDNELAVSVPVSAVLVRTDDIAVAVVGVRAYTVGVQFDLVVRLRTSPGGRRGPSPGDWPGAGLGDSLLLGVEFSDGRAASSLGSGLGGAADDDAPLLVQAGGGGDDRSWDESWWLHPVPSPGPLRFVFAAPALGVEETHAVVDGGLLAAAAESAVVLWPPQPPDDLEPPDLPPPPAGGWFGRLAQGPRRLLGDA